jgi:hypothetical protein
MSQYMQGSDGEEGERTGGLLETEAQRLQREADEYTKMLEHERK